MTNDIKAIRERAERATERPWWIERDGENDTCKLIGGPGAGREIAEFPYYAEFRREADEEFVTAARTDIPNLCDEVEELRARVSELERIVAGTIDPLFAASMREKLRAALIGTMAEHICELQAEIVALKENA